MSREELKTAAIECLAKAFRGDDIPMHVVQAATAIVLTPDPPEDDITAKYYELIYAVGKKYPSESRHETALRYIRNAETPSGAEAGVSARVPEEPHA